MKYLSLFSGIGGFELGIGEDHQCVGFSEIDKYAIQIYKSHYPKHENYGDITKIWDTYGLPDFELLVGGFPCQSFSIAGKRGGFSDTRGTLFFEICRILKQKQPRLILLENVKGLLSHDSGKTFTTIITSLDELGYDLEWQVLNSKDFGVPQNRERVFIVGHLRGTSRPKVFPLIPHGEATDELPRHVSNTLTRRYEGAQGTGTYIGEGKFNAQEVEIGTLRTHKDGQGFRKIKSGLAPTIPARAREDGSGQPVIRQTARGFNKGGMKKIVPTLGSNAWQHNNHLAIPVLTPNRPVKRQNGRRFKEDGEPSFTLTAQDQHGIYDGYKIRRLTPTECERLQGFPDGWTSIVSDTQRYKCLGNAVTVNVISAITQKLIHKR